MNKKSAIPICYVTDTFDWGEAVVHDAVKNNVVNITITGSQIPMPSRVGNISDAYANIYNKQL